MDASVELSAVGLTLMMTEIYDGLGVDMVVEAEPSEDTPSPT